MKNPAMEKVSAKEATAPGAGARRRSAKTSAKSALKIQLLRYRDLFQGSPQFRIELIREGVQAKDFKIFVSGLGIAQEKVCRMLDIAPATVNRKAAQHQALSREESEKVIGMAKLIGQVETMLEESGDAELMKDFDASKWLARWMDEPIPALAGKSPSEYMDTIEGQEMVSSLLAMMQTGAYA